MNDFILVIIALAMIVELGRDRRDPRPRAGRRGKRKDG